MLNIAGGILLAILIFYLFFFFLGVLGGVLEPVFKFLEKLGFIEKATTASKKVFAAIYPVTVGAIFIWFMMGLAENLLDQDYPDFSQNTVLAAWLIITALGAALSIALDKSEDKSKEKRDEVEK